MTRSGTPTDSIQLHDRAHSYLAVYHDFREVETTWRVVETAAPGYAFQTYDWLSLWYETVGAALRVEPFVVVVSDGDGRITALFPLAIRRRAGCRILEFLGAIVTDYNAPLFDPDMLTRHRPIDGLWDQIVALARPDLVLLQQMPEHLGDHLLNPMVTQRHAFHAANAYAARLPSTFNEFTAPRSARYFSETRRKRRNLAKRGAVRFQIAHDPDEIGNVIDVLFTQKQRKYGSDYVSRRAKSSFEEFYRRMAVAPFRGGQALTASLHVGDTIVATSLGIVHGRRFYGLMSGHEAGPWAQLSPGRALLQDLVQWCIAEGIETFDLSIGDEDYKHVWSDHCLKLYDSCYPVTAIGAAFLATKRLNARWRQWRAGAERKSAPGHSGSTGAVAAMNADHV